MVLLTNIYMWSGKVYLTPIFKWIYMYNLRKMQRAQASGQFKEQINFHLGMHYGDSEYNVAQLSHNMGLSRSQLFRKCKFLLGKSPVQLLKSYRLEKSTELLTKGIYNVTEVAYLSGFSSSSYFCKSFKKRYRILPSQLT